MSGIEDIADEMPRLAADACTDARHANGIRRMRQSLNNALRAQAEHLKEGNRLRYSAHTPSLPKLKFMGDK